MLIWVLTLLVGVIAGFINVLSGGGSLLTLPMLIFLGLPSDVANGTNRIGILVQNISGTLSFQKQGVNGFQEILKFLLPSVPGTLIGALLALYIPPHLFEKILGSLVLLFIFLKPKKGGDSDDDLEKPLGFKSGFSLFLAGIFCGFIQAGLGLILMAIFHHQLGFSWVKTNYFKVGLISLLTLPAMGLFAWNGKIAWTEGVLLAVGSGIGAWVGAHFAVKKGEEWVEWFFKISLVGLGLKLIFR